MIDASQGTSVFHTNLISNWKIGMYVGTDNRIHIYILYVCVHTTMNFNGTYQSQSHRYPIYIYYENMSGEQN